MIGMRRYALVRFFQNLLRRLRLLAFERVNAILTKKAELSNMCRNAKIAFNRNDFKLSSAAWHGGGQFTRKILTCQIRKKCQKTSKKKSRFSKKAENEV
jgi:hypothetical protein